MHRTTLTVFPSRSGVTLEPSLTTYKALPNTRRPPLPRGALPYHEAPSLTMRRPLLLRGTLGFSRAGLEKKRGSLTM
jgi:hypothetical protein